MITGFFSGKSFDRRFKQPQDEVFGKTIFLPDLIFKSKVTLYDVLDRFIMIRGFKGCFLLNDLKNGNSQCPHVYFTVVTSSKKHLRGLVVKCSGICVHIYFITPLKSAFTYPEIYDFDSSRDFIIKYVFRFDITMTDLILVQINQCLNNLFHYLLEFLKLSIKYFLAFNFNFQ